MRVPLRVVSFNLTILSELASVLEITSLEEAILVTGCCFFLGKDFFFNLRPNVKYPVYKVDLEAFIIY